MKIQYHGKKLSFLCVLFIKMKGEEGYALNVDFGIAWVKIEMNHCLCFSFRRKSDRTGIEIQRIRMFLLLRFIILQFFFFFFFVLIHLWNQTKLTYLRICAMRNNHNPNIGAVCSVLISKRAITFFHSPMSWNIYRCSTLEMFAKSEESLGSSSGIGSIKKESNEENPRRLIPTQFNCENRTGEEKCIWYCGNFCISVLTYKSAKQWKFRVLFYRQS